MPPGCGRELRGRLCPCSKPLEKLSLQLGLPGAPVRHSRVHQPTPSRAVVWVDGMREFMIDDILNEVGGSLHELRVQGQCALRAEAAPPASQHPDDEARPGYVE